MSVKTLGRHLIAEFYACDRQLLNDVDRIAAHLLQAAALIKATVLGYSFHRFAPQGVSGAVVITESHLSIHTWPEQGYVAADIFTCGELDPRPAFSYLGEVLASQSCRMQEIVRGVPEDLAGQNPFLPQDVTVITRWLDPQPARE